MNRTVTILFAAACCAFGFDLRGEQTGSPRRLLIADDSTRRLAIVAPNGSLEWEVEVGPIHDAWMLPNGNILFQKGWTKILEVTPEKKIVWEYDAATMNGNAGKRVEVHAFQRLENGWTMIAESGIARIIEVDKSGQLQREVKLKVQHPDAHSDTRLVRKLSNGNYLVAQERDGAVREYDREGKIVWEYEVPLFGKERKGGHGPEAFGNSIFSAARLDNGNTLIGGGNGHCVLEVTPEKKIVWKLEQHDLPGITLAWVTRVARLPNGNTLLGNCHAGPDNPQFIEVTEDKKVVWTFKDFKNFGNATTVQAVLEPLRRTSKSTKQDRAHWAFQPVTRPEVPSGKHPIDVLVLARLPEKRLSPPATPRELIRRTYFDLLGLPPAPEEVAAFEADLRADAYDRLIDRLLASPQYGERWGRHWLDVARFAQSNGYERDGEKPMAWRYRDYVIQAFNQDKPYDRFLLEQIAGDELPDATPESIVATGFQRLGVFDDEPDDKRVAEFDALDDILSTTSAAFLGVTLGCARCHDHKFDPISQSDYYAMLAFFRGVRLYENTAPSLESANFVPLTAPRHRKEWLAAREKKLKALESAATGDETAKKQLEAEIKKLKEEVPFEWALAVREQSAVPVTHVLIRGNPAAPGPEITPDFPEVLGGDRSALTPPCTGAESSGRRIALAQWIASPTNPLTARVMVNRIWQHHFGKGLVRTSTDFGHAGARPTHPLLLDWLAAEFVDSGWSVKKLHKTIMLSDTYRQSSGADSDRMMKIDPDNDLLWRQNLRRLEAEAIRDTVLKISGGLNPRMAGRGFFPHLSGEVLAGQSRPGLDWEVSSEAEKSRRSIYAFVRRTVPVPLLENFDYSNTTSPLGERVTTTVAPQALMLLNDDFLQEQATALATRLAREAADNPTAQIRRAYQLAVNRAPTARETEIAMGFLRRQADGFGAVASRITFRLDVANALSTDYFNRLGPEQFLLGPREGWTYHRGFWAPAYEGIRVVDRQRAPFALWQGTNFSDGIIEARVLLPTSCEFAGLLFRASAHNDVARGYEVVMDPRKQRVVLQAHGAEVKQIGEADAAMPFGKPFALKVEVRGPKVRVWLQDKEKPLLDIIDQNPILQAGRIGIRTWGAAVSLDDLIVRVPQAIAVSSGDKDVDRSALQSFCLLVLNLNEVFYVD